jgi:hypothetical protein
MPVEIILRHTWPMAVMVLFTLSGGTRLFRHRLS